MQSYTILTWHNNWRGDEVDQIALMAMFLVRALISVSSLDDLFIDLLALGIERPPVPNVHNNGEELPTTAVFVANWHEEEVLARMVEGNLARIPWPQVKFYLGVYPNDIGTR